ncbi:MAG: hypothetical protein HC877_18405 [Thioploca sp.]|nr:hypothetical protein [Thioploca sp.]
MKNSINNWLYQLPLLLIMISGLAGSGYAINEIPINKTNWLNHPKIQEIRNIYNQIESRITNNTLVKSEKSLASEEPAVPTSKTIYVDNLGTVRKYIEAAGSEDSALTSNYYYDHAGRLRFVFITGGAVNGSQLEHRIYFDTRGKRIWEIQKYLTDIHYTFPSIWPKKDLIFEPQQAFDK